VVELEKVNWSNRTIPVGTEDPIDIMTMQFSIPIWISSPAKVKKLGVVERIINSIYNAQGDFNDAVIDNDILLGTRQKVSPFGYQVLLIGNQLQALKQSAVINPTNNNTQPQTAPTSNEMWHAIVNMYGTLRPGISQIRLDSPWDDSEVIGFVSYDPTNDNVLLFDVDVDTIPQNTLNPINAVIDPLISGPGAGLPAAAVGQRYLVLENMGTMTNSPTAWGAIEAQANDIIEYAGGIWQVVFESTTASNVQFVTNLTTGLQYRWTGGETDGEWVKSYEGLYPGGEWSIVL